MEKVFLVNKFLVLKNVRVGKYTSVEKRITDEREDSRWEITWFIGTIFIFYK